MSKRTVIMHGNEFYKTWWVLEPEKDDSYDYLGMVTSAPDNRGFKYWTERNIFPFHVVEKSAYDKCLLDLNEMTAKYNFMVDSAQQNAKERDAAEAEAIKYRNVYSAEAITSRILSEELELLQNANSMILWGLTVAQLLSLLKYYEANTGNKAQDIK